MPQAFGQCIFTPQFRSGTPQYSVTSLQKSCLKAKEAPANLPPRLRVDTPKVLTTIICHRSRQKCHISLLICDRSRQKCHISLLISNRSLLICHCWRRTCHRSQLMRRQHNSPQLRVIGHTFQLHAVKTF